MALPIYLLLRKVLAASAAGVVVATVVVAASALATWSALFASNASESLKDPAW
jgi:hypothetical protein